jgi:threonine synthase
MQYRSENPGEYVGIVLSTAHYAKFLPTVEAVLGQKVPVPQRLADLLDLQKKSVRLGTDFEGFKAYLLA